MAYLIDFNEIIIRIKRIEEEERVNGAISYGPKQTQSCNTRKTADLQLRKFLRIPVVFLASRDAYVNES